MEYYHFNNFYETGMQMYSSSSEVTERWCFLSVGVIYGKKKQCSELQTFLVSIQIDVACLEQTSSLPHYSTHREMITI